MESDALVADDSSRFHEFHESICQIAACVAYFREGAIPNLGHLLVRYSWSGAPSAGMWAMICIRKRDMGGTMEKWRSHEVLW